jgi:hypothetical protein
MRTTASFTLISALCAALVGCGGDGTALPPTAAAGSAIDDGGTTSASIGDLDAVAQDAGVDALVQSGTGDGQVSTTTDAPVGATWQAPVRAAEAPLAGFTFSGSGSATVDLATVTWADGSRRFPNTTGTISVTWSGSWVPSQPAGTGGVGAWDTAMTNTTELVHTNPANGRITTIAVGAWNPMVHVEATGVRTSSQEWNLTVVRQRSIAQGNPVVATITQGDQTRTASWWGSRTGTVTMGRSAGTLSYTRDVVADWTFALTGGAQPHTVVWDRDGLDVIRVTVDGVTHGPFTRAQVRARWQGGSK